MVELSVTEQSSSPTSETPKNTRALADTALSLAEAVIPAGIFSGQPNQGEDLGVAATATTIDEMDLSGTTGHCARDW